MKLKYVILLSYIMVLCNLCACGTPTAAEKTVETLVVEEETFEAPAMEAAVANYEIELIMTEAELENIDWDEEIHPYMEYDWLSDKNIERYSDTSWHMQLADLNLDGQREMLVTLPIYSGKDLTFVFTLEDEKVVYCGKIIAGAAYNDNDSFIKTDGYLPSNCIDVYQNESGELKYLSSEDDLHGTFGYYQIYESIFNGKSISCKPLSAIYFSEDSNKYAYVMGEWQEGESEVKDDKNYTAFVQVMEEYMEGYERVDILFTASEFYVPGIVDKLPEEKKKIVRNNIVAGFAKVLELD